MERVVCGNCKTEYEDEPGVPIEARKPCSSCGSTFRLSFVSTGGEITPRSKLNYKGRRCGKNKPFIWGRVGADLFRKIKKWMHLERVFNRENDKYKEIVIDPITGNIIHYCEEPLSKHQGHGSAKKRKTDNTEQESL